MAISQAAQDYLKAIYKLQNNPAGNGAVNTSTLAETVGVAPASVTHMKSGCGW